MSFKKANLYPCNPFTLRGESTKLSSHKDKIVYTNGRTVIIRDLKLSDAGLFVQWIRAWKNPSLVTAYSGHVQNTVVARISPTGYYCASGDIGGTVRIWDIVGEDQTLKAEYKVLSGKINDLEWDGESKRIIAVGDGREKFAHPFMMDTGSSTGEIMGHSKPINAVSIRHQRPFRAATGGDDTTIIFHQGAPYKYDKTIKAHTRFVQDIRYAPSGDYFSSVGSDAKIFLYDGKTGETLGEFTEGAHSGTIYACAWSSDSKSLVTSSADCTVKLWDVETKKGILTWKLGTGVNHQQVGNTWTGGDEIVSVSVSGDLNVFDKRVGDEPSRILHGPSKAITATLPTSKDTSGTFLAGTADGRILSFSGSEYTYPQGEGHSSLVAGLASDGNKVYSIGYDDHVREIDLAGTSFIQASCPTASQPKFLAIAGDSTVFVAEADGVEAIRSNQKLADISLKFTPTAVAASGNVVAIGGEDHKVRLYDWDGKALKEAATLEGNKGVISALAFSSDGALLAAGDSSGKIVLYDAKERKAITSRWTFHSARIHSLAWTPDNKHCASGSLDTHVYVWSVAKPTKNIAIKNAGPGGVNAVFWLGEGSEDGNLLASAGADGCVRTWEIKFHV